MSETKQNPRVKPELARAIMDEAVQGRIPRRLMRLLSPRQAVYVLGIIRAQGARVASDYDRNLMLRVDW